MFLDIQLDTAIDYLNLTSERRGDKRHERFLRSTIGCPWNNGIEDRVDGPTQATQPT